MNMSMMVIFLLIMETAIFGITLNLSGNRINGYSIKKAKWFDCVYDVVVKFIISVKDCEVFIGINFCRE